MLLFTYDEKLHRKTIREEGKEEGRLEEFNALMKNLKISREQAMDVLDIPEEERNRYRK